MQFLRTMKVLYNSPIANAKKIKGVIFDMDGTLTVPGLIDFKGMRRKLGIEDTVDILRHINAMHPEKKSEALAVIDEFEHVARKNLKLQPTLTDLLEYLNKQNIKHAIVTRNSTYSLTHFIELLGYDSFSHKISRDSPLAVKPDPASSFFICKEWNFETHEVMFVGDHLDDLQTGRRAGNVTCLLLNEKNAKFIPEADLTVKQLVELKTLLDGGFEVERPENLNINNNNNKS